MPDQSVLERAFELARSGQCASIEDIVRRLRREGHYDELLAGPVLRRQLRTLINEARSL